MVKERTDPRLKPNCFYISDGEPVEGNQLSKFTIENSHVGGRKGRGGVKWRLH